MKAFLLAFVLLFEFQALEATPQGVVPIDTLLHTDTIGIVLVRSYGGGVTLLGVQKNKKVLYPYRQTHYYSHDNGLHFDRLNFDVESATSLRSYTWRSRNGVVATVSRVESLEPFELLTVFEQGEVRFSGVFSFLGVHTFTIQRLEGNPYKANELYAIVGDPYGTAATPTQFLLKSTDYGETWNQISTPQGSFGGLGHMIVHQFDYSDPGTWYVAISDRDVHGHGGGYVWYETHDDGKSYLPSEKKHFLRGMFGENTEVESSSSVIHYEPSKGFSPIPVVVNHQNNSSDTSYWMRNIYDGLIRSSPRTFLSFFISILYHEHSPNTEQRNILSISLLNRNFIAIGVYGREVIDEDTVSVSGLVVTHDGGRTWQWMVDPTQGLYISSIDIDPIAGYVYALISRFEGGDTNHQTLIRTKQPVTSVANYQEHNNPTLRCWPQPATETVTLDFGQEVPLPNTASVVSATGETTQVAILDGGQTSRFCHLDVSHISSGVYFLEIRGAPLRPKIVILH